MDNRLTCPAELCRLASFATHGVSPLGSPVLARWLPGGSVPTHGYCANCADPPELGAGASWRPSWPPCSPLPVPRSPAQQSSTPSPSRSPDLSRSLRETPSRAYRRHFVRLPTPKQKGPRRCHLRPLALSFGRHLAGFWFVIPSPSSESPSSRD